MRTLSILSAILLLASCGADKKEELASLRDTVMELHDEVMPKMGELRRTAKTLREKAANSEVETEIAEYNEAAQAIEEANEAMMNWMRNYEPDFDGSYEEIRDYLDQQQNSITEVKNAMNTSLERGKELIN